MITPTNLTQDIFNLAKTASTIKGELPIAQLTRLHPELTNTTGSVRFKFTGETNAHKHALLHVQCDGMLAMTCQRCLEPLSYTVAVDNTLHIVASEDELDSEEDELNAIAAGNHAPEKIVGAVQFDFLSLLEDEIILSLPFSTVHDNCPSQLPTSSGQKTSAFDVLAQLKST